MFAFTTMAIFILFIIVFIVINITSVIINITVILIKDITYVSNNINDVI